MAPISWEPRALTKADQHIYFKNKHHTHHTHTHTHTLKHIHTQTHTHTHTHTSTQTQIACNSTHPSAHTHTHTHMHTRIIKTQAYLSCVWWKQKKENDKPVGRREEVGFQFWLETGEWCGMPDRERKRGMLLLYNVRNAIQCDTCKHVGIFDPFHLQSVERIYKM